MWIFMTSGARRGGAYDSGRELVGSVGQNISFVKYVFDLIR